MNGISTSLPKDVQHSVLSRIVGLERAEIMRYGYAVEYDFAPPTQLHPSLESKRVAGLFFAGQINGTTGYEEAAAQGLLAGINAARSVAKKEPVVVGRHQGYIGVLIDDLVTRGVDEPYRMFTSRAEFRIALRHDNADQRLTPIGEEIGLVRQEDSQRLVEKRRAMDRLWKELRSHRHEGLTLEQWLRRPQVSWGEVVGFRPELAAHERSPLVVDQVVTEAKYAGYAQKQVDQVEKFRKLENRRIPASFDFSVLPQLRFEAKEKLSRVRPTSLGQASRISGITPADLATVLMYLESGIPGEAEETHR